MPALETVGAATAGGGAQPWRVEAFDGLRGLIIITVVLGHVSAFLWPIEGIRSTPFVRGLVGGGAVTVFFVISGLLATDSLLRDRRDHVLDPVRFFLRRLVRVGSQIAAVCAAVVVVFAVDATETNSSFSTVNTVTHSLTFTTNWLYTLNPLGARPDMGHLWFTSVQQQWYLVLPLVVLLLGHRPRALALVAAAGAAAAAMYRVLSLSDATWYTLAVGTLSRADGLLLGVALAGLLPRLRKAPRAHALGWFSLLAIPFMLSISPSFGPLAFLSWWSVAFLVIAAVLVGAVALIEPRTALSRFLTWGPLARLGRASLVVYVWHYPIIFLMGRHAPDLTPWATTTAYVAILFVVCWAAVRWIQAPVRRWLGRHLLRPTPPPLDAFADSNDRSRAFTETRPS